MARPRRSASTQRDNSNVLAAPPTSDRSTSSKPSSERRGYDIGSIAEDHATTPIPFVDDRMMDEDGELIDLEPATTKVRENVVRLGNAAADSVTDRTIREAGEHHAAATRQQSTYEGLETQLISATRSQAQVAQLEMWAVAMRHNTRPKHSKLMSLAAKPLFLLGDTSVIGGMLYLSGAPPLTAAATGISAATGAVFAGSTVGGLAAVAHQRRRRGPVPDGCPDALADLYEAPDTDDTSLSLWLNGAAAYAIALSVGVVLVGIGTGISMIEAMGTGLLTMLTVGGSGFAEAYSTNDAVDRLEKLQSLRAGYDSDARPINDLRASAQEELVRAGTVRSAGSHEAAAAMNTTMVMSDPTTHDPRTFGYRSPMAAESTLVDLRAQLPERVAAPDLPHGSPSRGRESTSIIATINRSFAATPIPGVAQPPLSTAIPLEAETGRPDDVHTKAPAPGTLLEHGDTQNGSGDYSNALSDQVHAADHVEFDAGEQPSSSSNGHREAQR